MKQQSGIYKIQSSIKPERIYIGSAVNYKRRKNLHLFNLRKNNHHSLKLQNHYNKYGENDLLFELIIVCEKHDLIKQEQIFIDLYNPWFNNSRTAGNCLGVKHTVATRKKVSESHKGLIRTKEHCKNLSISLTGNKLSEETRQKIRMAHIGRKLTKEHVEKIRSKTIGQKRSEEFKDRMRNRVISEKTRNRISASRKGIKFSEEHKIKLSNARKKVTPWNKGMKNQYMKFS